MRECSSQATGTSAFRPARFFLVSDPGDPTIAAAALIDSLEDEDVIVRSEAVHSLGVVAKHLMYPVPSRRRAAPAIQALTMVLLGQRDEVSPPVSSNLSRAMGRPIAIPTGERIGRRAPGVLTGADEAEIGDPAQALDDPAWMAARALGEAAPGTDCAEIAIAALTEALRTDRDERRLKVIVRSLSRFGSAADRVVPDLTLALKKAVAADGASDLWLGIVADALVRIAPGTIEADEAVVAVTGCLQSGDDQERQIKAVKSLMRLAPRHTSQYRLWSK